MAGSIGRSISIGLSANTKNFAKSLRSAEKNLERFKNGVKVLGTAVAASFAAMGAAALFFGKSAIDAALEDQKGQRRLQKALENTTKATRKQRLAVEDSIDKYQMWYGVTDDKLRPAFQRLTQATKNIAKTQKLMNLALNISAGTGKDVETVANALAKAYGGNLAAVQRLGLGLDKATIKSGNFEKVQGQLTKMFQGQGKAAAQSFQGQVDRLRITWDEFQESVGTKILPHLGKLLRYIQNDLLPFLGEVRKGFSGTEQETISPKLKQIGKAMGFEPGKSAAYTLGESLKIMADSFGKLFKQLGGTEAGKSTSTLEDLANSMTRIADAITSVNNAVSGAGKWWGDFTGSSGKKVNTPGTGIIEKYGRKSGEGFGNWWNRIQNGGVSTQASGGPVQAGRRYLVGENGPEMFVPSSNGGIRTASQTRGMLGGGVTINLNGIVDADSARRSIEHVLQNSGKRLGAINLTGSAL